jgi:hypothetical protein
MNIKKESDENRKFNTGAEKQHSEGKGTPVLFPGDAYIEVCKHFEDGAKHYDARNWEQGIPLSELINSLERHIADEKMADTSERHDRAMAWNAIAYLATKIRIQRGLLPKELDDMPKYEQVKEPNEITLAAMKEAEVLGATIECVPSRGWQIRLANGMFLCSYEDISQGRETVYKEFTVPFYYRTRQQACYHLAAYQETLK